MQWCVLSLLLEWYNSSYVLFSYRLTPVYGFIIMMYAGFFPYMGEGPTPDNTMQYNFCRENWYLNIFYLNTFILIDDTVSC